jgi:hypothetical protein
VSLLFHVFCYSSFAECFILNVSVDGVGVPGKNPRMGVAGQHLSFGIDPLAGEPTESVLLGSNGDIWVSGYFISAKPFTNSSLDIECCSLGD